MPSKRSSKASTDSVREWRRNRVFEIGVCDLCCEYDFPTLCLHEIARGCCRKAALCEPAAQLCVCFWCHQVVERMPLALQLALLLHVRPTDYSICRYNQIATRKADHKDVQRQLVVAVAVRGHFKLHKRITPSKLSALASSSFQNLETLR